MLTMSTVTEFGVPTAHGPVPLPRTHARGADYDPVPASGDSDK